jgi:hypothetical protein
MKSLEPRSGVCLEPNGFIDADDQARYSSMMTAPRTIFPQRSVFRFQKIEGPQQNRGAELL